VVNGHYLHSSAAFRNDLLPCIILYVPLLLVFGHRFCVYTCIETVVTVLIVLRCTEWIILYFVYDAFISARAFLSVSVFSCYLSSQTPDVNSLVTRKSCSELHSRRCL